MAFPAYVPLRSTDTPTHADVRALDRLMVAIGEQRPADRPAAPVAERVAPVEAAPAAVAPPAPLALALEIDGDRVTVTGSVKGDAAHAACLPRPWVWSRNAGGYVLPRSLTPWTRESRIRTFREACERHGVALEVEDAGVILTEAQRRENRTERLEVAADRHENAAERAAAEAASRYAAARREADYIPMGQPILVGHHSERGHRAALARIDSNLTKSFEADREATRRAQRAENIRVNLERGDSSVTIGNRIERAEAELRKLVRRIEEGDLAAKLSAQNPEKAARVAYAIKPLGDEHRARLSAECERLTEAVEIDRATLAAMVEAGAVRVFGKDNVSKGDAVKIRGQWCIVVRANAKTVACESGYSWTDNSPWREVKDHRTAAQLEAAKLAREAAQDA